MSPPEVWGPAVWTLFHTLIEKMNPDAYPFVIGSMFGMIIRICKVLPCPECSNDASNFLAKIKLSDYKTKDEFKNMLYLFHNWVNAKKRKPLYNYSNLQKYAGFNLIFVLNNFIAKYNTKGNMKLLAESFQRSFVVRDLVTWFKLYSRAFIQPVIVRQVREEPIVEEPVTEEPIIEEPIIEESVTEEPVTEEPVTEEPIIEESVSLEEKPEDIAITDENITKEINIDIQEVKSTTSNKKRNNKKKK